MVVKDWMQDAAREIDSEPYEDAYGEDEIKAFILKHCPLKPDVAYMPVPRCETCKHWKEFKNADGMGLCKQVDQLSTPVPKDFGCVQWEAK